MAFASGVFGFQTPAARHPHPNPGMNLALAVIAASTVPQILLNEDLRLIAASGSFCRVFQIDPTSVQNRPLCELGTGEWNVPLLGSLLEATASGRAEVKDYEFEFRRPGKTDGRLILNIQKLEYGDEENVRLLATLQDVTETRIASKRHGDLLREKTVFLQEQQHRVANSLQIVASLLMQSARRVQSEEAKDHLRNAHQRVMSVASLQKQLAVSRAGNVELRSYLTALCANIGASMIRDQDQLSLDVSVDDSVTDADGSVSLGLIVTELVINALKHAFPKDRAGKIRVRYRSEGPHWTLSVTDNGIGMPADAASSHHGLGTSIVRALSAQLRGVFRMEDAKPGTAASIVHRQIGIIEAGDDAVAADGDLQSSV
jgi:two-component system, sensor histidine kinase PdtaS